MLCDQPPNVSEQVSDGGGLGHLDGGIAAVAGELRSDL